MLIENNLPIGVPTLDELVFLECKIRDIRQYYERQGVLKCMQRLSESSQLLKTHSEDTPDYHKGYSAGFMQAHKIIDAMLRES